MVLEHQVILLGRWQWVKMQEERRVENHRMTVQGAVPVPVPVLQTKMKQQGATVRQCMSVG